MAEFLDYPGLEHFYKLLKAEIDSASLSDRFTLGYETQEVGSQSYTVVTVWDQGDVNVGETSALFVDYTQKMVALPEGREATANDAKGWADVTIRFVATSDFDIQFNQVIHATGGIKCETGNEYLLKILGHHVILRTLKDWMDAEPSPEPIDPTNGTLDIEGSLDLSEDFKVNGNVIVTGDITGSGTLYATGTITCNGTTSATVNAGATLDECDISIDNGTTTFNSDTTVADGKVYVGGAGVTNVADCTVYCDMEIESSGTGMRNNGAFTLPSEVTIDITNTDNGTEAYGIYNHDNASFEAYGDININNSGSGNSKYAHAIYNHNGASFTIDGKTSITCTGTGSNTYAHGIFNNATFNITENATVDITNHVAAILGHGIYNFNGGIFTLAGKMTIYNAGTATGSDVYLYALCNEHSSSVFTITEIADVELTCEGTTNNGTVYGICNYDDSILTINGAVTIYTTGTGQWVAGFATITSSSSVNGTIDITVSGSGSVIYAGLSIAVKAALTVNGAITITGPSYIHYDNNATLNGSGTITVNGSKYTW